MTTLKLYDNPASIHAQYARIVLDEAGIRYEKEMIDLPLQNLEPYYANISPVLSVPALEIFNIDGSKKDTVTDSRDIINYCANLEGGKKLFPQQDKLKEMDVLLDLIYQANGGQISFQAYPPRDPLFGFALTYIVGPLRGKKVRGYLSDNEISGSPKMKEIYEDCLKRLDKPNPSLVELTVRANEAMVCLDERLGTGPWLLGNEHTAVDCVAAVWVQWICWAKVPAIKVTPRVLDFLERSRQRPGWSTTKPLWVIHYIRKRLYIATSLVGCSVAAAGYLFVKRFEY